MTLAQIGVGLRNPHLFYFSENKHSLPLLEIHSENFFNPYGREHHLLEKVGEHYPLSFHGVGLSLGSINGLNQNHLAKLKELNDHFKPALLSEHISWSEHKDTFYNDLISLPYNEESLDIICRNIDKFQTHLNRQILIENPSSYLSFKDSTYHEADFLNMICKKTNCGLLLDVNNIFVSAHNLGFNSKDYLTMIEAKYIAELHIAGPEEMLLDGETILIDSHSTYPTKETLALLKIITKLTDAPIILEWDRDLPEAAKLIEYAQQINQDLNVS
jgi:uncharacterized protein